ncbi:hypothetical protein K502DRAFT_321806 [Neoconidiobolus thromboides FSU 785]|nr:hypothetical protein K502DRAFT_321806 [Neoconidiobolus thromboides FSU 785]
MSDSILMAYAAIGTMASSIVYIGSNVALKKIKTPKSEKKSNKDGEDSDEDSEDEEESESISSEDAYMFPIYGSGALFGLYLLFKYINKEYINYLLSAYIAIAGCFSLTKLLSLITKHTLQLNLVPFKFNLNHDGKDLLKFKFDYSHIVNFIISIGITAYYLLTKNWIANNFFGVAFSMSAIQLIQLDSFKTGMILLAGLFIYDIFWVFGTEVMVTVATKFDAPIKLLWPKSFSPLITGEKLSFTLLGLGDIVMPGIFVALCLAFDRHLAIEAEKAKNKDSVNLKLLQKKPTQAKFSKPYFTAGLIAYVLGLGTTIFVMHTFKAAQPALLYLSPACIAAPLIVAFSKNQIKELFAFEADEESKNKKKEESDKKENEDKSSASKEKVDGPRRRKI